MRGLVIATVLLVLLAVPAGVGLVGTAERYLTATRDIASLRVEVVGQRPPVEQPGGYRRVAPGPDVTLRFSGLEQITLTLAELNFELTWQGTRLGTASSFPKVPLPRGAAATVTVETNLEPGQDGRLRELLAHDEPGILLTGRARLLLPNTSDGVWLNLRGQLRAGVPGQPGQCRL